MGANGFIDDHCYKAYKKLTTVLRTSIAEIVKEIDRVDVNAINLINGWMCVLYCDVSVVIDNLWLLGPTFDIRLFTPRI